MIHSVVENLVVLLTSYYIVLGMVSILGNYGTEEDIV